MATEPTTGVDDLGRPSLTITLTESEVDLVHYYLGLAMTRVAFSPQIHDLRVLLDDWLDVHPPDEGADLRADIDGHGSES